MVPRPFKDAQQVRATARRAAGYGSFGLLSTYPPTQCGLATFSASLRDGLLADDPGTEVGVVRMVDQPAAAAGAEVVYELRADRHGDPARAAERLNGFDVVVVQHEYGIFGGRDGDQVLEVLRRIRVPVIIVLRVLLRGPAPRRCVDHSVRNQRLGDRLRLGRPSRAAPPDASSRAIRLTSRFRAPHGDPSTRSSAGGAHSGSVWRSRGTPRCPGSGGTSPQPKRLAEGTSPTATVLGPPGAPWLLSGTPVVANSGYPCRRARRAGRIAMWAVGGGQRAPSAAAEDDSRVASPGTTHGVPSVAA